MKINLNTVPVKCAVSIAVLAGISAAGAGTAFAATPSTHRAPAQVRRVRAAAPNPRTADKATQMHITVNNTTGEDLTLVSANHAGGVTHWQQQAQQTLAHDSSEVVTDYGSGNNSIDLVYKDAAGNTFTFDANDPLLNYNTASASSSNTSYTINYNVSTGHNDYTTFNIVAGHTFGYTGGAQTYTVPAGVTEVNVDLIGGTGGGHGALEQISNGAEIKGTLAVTPGEVLTLGVGGQGNSLYNNVSGGWGLSFGGDSFSGGNGLNPASGNQGGGGGASVIVDESLPANDQILAVAGGAGGIGNDTAQGNDSTYGLGGEGGYNGTLVGGNGHGGDMGGQAGSMGTYQGQSVTSPGNPGPGAGGGGYAGGAAGMSGSGSGGGAGSSYDADLTNASVNVAPSLVGDNPQNGQIVITAVN